MSFRRAPTCLRSRFTGTTRFPATRTSRPAWISRATGWITASAPRCDTVEGRDAGGLAAGRGSGGCPGRAASAARPPDAGPPGAAPAGAALAESCRLPKAGRRADAFIPGRAPRVAEPPSRPVPAITRFWSGPRVFMATRDLGEAVRLLPNSRWADYKLPAQTLTRSPGHQRDWIRACKGGSPACSNFSYSGPFTEWVVLGAISVRFEGKLLWDAAKMEFTNNKAANAFVKPAFRAGWEIKDV